MEMERKLQLWPGVRHLRFSIHMIRNLLDSWLDYKIPDCILEIPVHQKESICHVIKG